MTSVHAVVRQRVGVAWARTLARAEAARRRRRVDVLLARLDAQTPATLLLAAARIGDAATIERLLSEGADPSAPGAFGMTALHEAAVRKHVEAAGLLLARGADHRRKDGAGRAPLGSELVDDETLHAVRQRFHRTRSAKPLPAPRSERAAAWADELERNGIVRVSGLIAPPVLGALRADLEHFVADLEAKLARGEGVYRHYDEEAHWWPKDQAYVCNNAFKYSRELTRWCCDPEVREVAGRYLGKPFVIQRGVAMRYLPGPTTDNDMFGWHHDMEEKRVKLMILLSDVGESDQHMRYVLGSHRLFHPLAMFQRNACGLDYCRAHLGEFEVFDAVGDAGDVFFFDSNGAHRANRKATGQVRDAYFVEYSADRSGVWGGDVDPAAIPDLPPVDNPFRDMLVVDKLWHRPRANDTPAWAGNLRNVDVWAPRTPV